MEGMGIPVASKKIPTNLRAPGWEGLRFDDFSYQI